MMPRGIPKKKVLGKVQNSEINTKDPNAAQETATSSIVGNEEFSKAVKLINEKGYEIITDFELAQYRSRISSKSVVRIETKTLYADGTTRKEVQNGY